MKLVMQRMSLLKSGENHRLTRIGMSGVISKMFWEVGLHHSSFDLLHFLHVEASREIVDSKRRGLLLV